MLLKHVMKHTEHRISERDLKENPFSLKYDWHSCGKLPTGHRFDVSALEGQDASSTDGQRDLALCSATFRLSSIDTKYHIWKMGVVLTDNVSVTPCCLGPELHHDIKTVTSHCSPPVPSVLPLSDLVHRHVHLGTLQQLLLCRSSPGHRHGRQDPPHHSVLGHPQRETGMFSARACRGRCGYYYPYQLCVVHHAE